MCTCPGVRQAAGRHVHGQLARRACHTGPSRYNNSKCTPDQQPVARVCVHAQQPARPSNLAMPLPMLKHALVRVPWLLLLVLVLGRRRRVLHGALACAEGGAGSGERSGRGHARVRACMPHVHVCVRACAPAHALARMRPRSCVPSALPCHLAALPHQTCPPTPARARGGCSMCGRPSARCALAGPAPSPGPRIAPRPSACHSRAWAPPTRHPPWGGGSEARPFLREPRRRGQYCAASKHKAANALSNTGSKALAHTKTLTFRVRNLCGTALSQSSCFVYHEAIAASVALPTAPHARRQAARYMHVAATFTGRHWVCKLACAAGVHRWLMSRAALRAGW